MTTLVKFPAKAEGASGKDSRAMRTSTRLQDRTGVRVVAFMLSLRPQERKAIRSIGEARGTVKHSDRLPGSLMSRYLSGQIRSLRMR
ncbi:MAG: hypothetical protein AUH81_18220 [Candidatus Rokubacteria bacterium 13_1_40CM_4_69_5]|nr:MAG: hypothetical protein AUH81_18220 [Candidatus Rokubacteria bacterium 13_1_40CM_4_69_5]